LSLFFSFLFSSLNFIFFLLLFSSFFFLLPTFGILFLFSSLSSVLSPFFFFFLFVSFSYSIFFLFLILSTLSSLFLSSYSRDITLLFLKLALGISSFLFFIYLPSSFLLPPFLHFTPSLSLICSFLFFSFFPFFIFSSLFCQLSLPFVIPCYFVTFFRGLSIPLPSFVIIFHYSLSVFFFPIFTFTVLVHEVYL